MTTIPVLDPVTDINDSDLVMVTTKQGHSYTINGAELEKRNKIIMASNTTVTGAPLKAGRCVRIYFSADITANDGNSVMQINYNGVNYYVKAPKDGSLINFVAHAVGSVYKYVQAYTTLELLFDGNQFVIIGNPVVISNSDYVINADGSIIYKGSRTIINDYMNIIRYPATYTQRQVFYEMFDELALNDFNGALAYVLGNVDGQPFNNIYQLNGIRYFRNGENEVFHVEWNKDIAIGKVITILFTRI